MNALSLLDDCVARARRVPDNLIEPHAGLDYCDALLADLDLAFEWCSQQHDSEDLSLVLSQLLQLKWLVYEALSAALAGHGWSSTAVSGLRRSARRDLAAGKARLAGAVPVRREGCGRVGGEGALTGWHATM